MLTFSKIGIATMCGIPIQVKSLISTKSNKYAIETKFILKHYTRVLSSGLKNLNDASPKEKAPIRPHGSIPKLTVLHFHLRKGALGIAWNSNSSPRISFKHITNYAQ